MAQPLPPGEGLAAGALPEEKEYIPSARDREIYHQRVIEGKLPSEIAQAFSLKKQTIANIVQRVQRALARKFHLLERLEPEAELHLLIERLEAKWLQAMQGWYRSCQEQKSSLLCENGGRVRRTVTSRDSPGRISFLTEARRILLDLMMVRGVREEVARRRVAAHDLDGLRGFGPASEGPHDSETNR
jgi:hypothetical protein